MLGLHEQKTIGFGQPNPAPSNWFLSLGDGTDKPTCKKIICKFKNGPELG